MSRRFPSAAEDLAGDLLVRPVARTAEIERLADRRRVRQGADDDGRDVAGVDRLEPGATVARHRDQAGRDPDEARDDVEEPVALAELERRLEDRPVEPGRADQRLGLRLRARVVQVGNVLDAHRAHVDEPLDAGRLHRDEDRAGPLGIDEAQVGAAREVARDGDEVDDRIDAGQRRAERLRPGDIADAGPRSHRAGAGGDPADDAVARLRTAHERDDAMTRGQEGRDEVAADEPAGAGDEDGGHVGDPSWFAATHTSGAISSSVATAVADASDRDGAGIVASTT